MRLATVALAVCALSASEAHAVRDCGGDLITQWGDCVEQFGAETRRSGDRAPWRPRPRALAARAATAGPIIDKTERRRFMKALDRADCTMLDAIELPAFGVGLAEDDLEALLKDFRLAVKCEAWKVAGELSARLSYQLHWREPGAVSPPVLLGRYHSVLDRYHAVTEQEKQ